MTHQSSWVSHRYDYVNSRSAGTGTWRECFDLFKNLSKMGGEWRPVPAPTTSLTHVTARPVQSSGRVSFHDPLRAIEIERKRLPRGGVFLAG